MHASRLRLLLPALTLLAALLVATAAPAAQDPDAINGKLGATKSQEDSLRQSRSEDQSRIAGYQARIDELQAKLGPLQSDLDGKQAELESLQSRLRDARARLVRLRATVKRDQQVLADQLVGVYESSPPDIVHVVMDAKGFSDLIEQVDQLKAVGKQNLRTVTRLRAEKAQVSAQTKRLTSLAGTQRALVVEAAAQRDAVAHIKLQVVDQQYVYVKARDKKSARIDALADRRKSLEKDLRKAQAAQAGIATYTGPVASGGADGFGFFQASGTNYSVGDEPTLAAKLNQLGKDLHLHLIGLSGYRTPQHSVEVGGFPNDPHTRGEASDTPGVEGVPESVLNSYGLTRPFAGAAEADHIQLVGSI
jgi:peptidoglycan hydrolase CwlO-like protein